MPVTELLSTPLVLPASVAGALAALFVMLAAIALLDRMALDSQAAERRALLQRNAALEVGALAPGSMLSCLGGSAGEAIENACEAAVFANPQSAASAVAYSGARLALLKDAADFAQRSEPTFVDAFAPARRALELDRYGIAAHVLAVRDGCTADDCAAFALLRDTAALKANLRARAFDNYVARYAAAWSKSEPKPDNRPMAEKQPSASVASAPAPAQPPSGQPVSTKYDFPTAASIPPVSIMNAEPPLPKGAEAASASADSGAVPVPQRRPQTQAATPPAR
ncbi:MAG TPA: hypothetical protein VJZ74_02035 [Pseudolabrys sp.]|nr:hypothetical protein [Pseudolabrys sp.]